MGSWRGGTQAPPTACPDLYPRPRVTMGVERGQLLLGCLP